VTTWLVIALVAAFWVSGGMRHAEQGEQRRLARAEARRRRDDPDAPERRTP